MDLKDGGAQSRLSHKVHGCHYSCSCGPLKAFDRESVYHRHLHMLCLAVRCDRKHACDRDPSASPGGDAAPAVMQTSPWQASSRVLCLSRFVLNLN